MAYDSYIVQEVDGASLFQLEDSSGSLLLETAVEITDVDFGYVADASADGSGTSAAAVIPSGTQAGHVMLAFIAHTVAAATISTAPTGWTLIGPDPDPADLSCWCYAKTAVASEPAPTWEFSTSGTWTVDIVTYAGVTEPTTAVAEQVGTAASNVISLGPATPTATGSIAVAYAVLDATALSRTWTESGSMTERVEDGTIVLQRVVADETLVSADPATRDLTASGSANDIGGFLVLLAPSAVTESVAPRGVYRVQRIPTSDDDLVIALILSLN